jgi:protein required for attachment to host cells
MRTQSGNYFRQPTHSKKHVKKWYLLANRISAVIYEDIPHETFKFVERMKNPSGHLTEGQMDSDRPGTGYSSAGGGTIHHGLDRTFHHHEQNAKRFARAIAKHLLHSKRSNQYQELILAAEPHFLGLLRLELASEVQSLVTFEVPREYLEGSDAEMQAAIRKAIEKSES